MPVSAGSSSQPLINPIIGPRVRRWIVRASAALVFSGLGTILLWGFILAAFSPHWAKWVWLPYHGWRFRVMFDEFGRVAIRTYFGSWADTRINVAEFAAAAMLAGCGVLLTLLPDRICTSLAEGREARKRRFQQRGLCPNCNYNLTANTSGVCPECGTPVQNA